MLLDVLQSSEYVSCRLSNGLIIRQNLYASPFQSDTADLNLCIGFHYTEILRFLSLNSLDSFKRTTLVLLKTSINQTFSNVIPFN